MILFKVKKYFAKNHRTFTFTSNQFAKINQYLNDQGLHKYFIDIFPCQNENEFD